MCLVRVLIADLQSSSAGTSRGTPPLPGPPRTDSLAWSGLPKCDGTATWRLPRNNSLDCPRLPGLAWGRLVGCGSFGRVYKGGSSPQAGCNQFPSNGV